MDAEVYTAKIMLRLNPMAPAKAKYHALMALSERLSPFQAKYKLMARGAKIITYPKMPENSTGTRPKLLTIPAMTKVASMPADIRPSTPAMAVLRLEAADNVFIDYLLVTWLQ
jgi:hypothetical protein